ncbi:MAG: metalloregulator ArsR/SmtB family transcription factor [Oscillospiraceae bacterium]|jgi:DNA-binding transcriptional ArsR family regulator|nr:metalloregulator ArsR/SmtB family transcription factor [Oscillospiraceae bacterium]
MQEKRPLLCDCGVMSGDIVDEVRAQMPPGGDFHQLSSLYKMFSDPTRLQILWALNCHELCVCDLTTLLGMTKSAISHQLKGLRLANLVKYEKRGKSVCYSLADSHVKDIFEKGFEHIHE